VALQRRATGRDLSLSLRMIVVMALLAVFYGVLGAICVDIAIRNAADDWRAPLIPVAFFALGVLHFNSARKLVLSRTRAEDFDFEPVVRGHVERLAALADIPAPKLARSPLGTPNALAVGMSARSSVVVVTDELLRRLDREELEAVLAHEISHIANRDGVVLTAASFFRTLAGFLGAPGLIDSDDEPRKVDATDRFERVVYAPVRWILLAIGSPLTLALSRYREYAADRGAALLTGRPELVIAALRKLAGGGTVPLDDLRRVQSVHAFWLVPVTPHRLALLSDHPPLEKRIARLEKIAREMGKLR
jgi:heat shock protein HtpX